MKMRPETYAALKEAIAPVMEACAIASGELNERRRWDCLWKQRDFPVSRLYNEGLDDDNIDTALRKIVKELSV